MGKKSKGEVVIVTRGLKAKIITPLPDHVIRALTSLPEMIWMDIEDLNNSLQFYNHPYCWVGTASKIAQKLTQMGYSVKVSPSKRSKPEFKWNYTGTPREGQNDCVGAILKSKRGWIEATTGAGKTHIIVSIICDIGKPTLVVVYNTTPFEQLVDTARDFSNLDYAIWSEGVTGDAPVIFANIQTLSAILRSKKDPRKKWIQDVCKVIIFDECHHSASPGSVNLTMTAENIEYLVGLTATKRNTDDRKAIFEAMFGPKPMATMPYADNIDRGNSVPITVRIIDAPTIDYKMCSRGMPQWLKNQNYMKVVKRYIIGGDKGRHDIIRRRVRKHNKRGRTVLVSVSKVAHAEQLFLRIPDAEILVASGPYASSKAERLDILDRMRHREIKCLISTVVREAVDIPSLDTVLLVMEGKSNIMVTQSLRNTRACDIMLRTGHYRKKRGYVEYMRNNCDFLTDQSRQVIAQLKKIVKTHPKNKFIDPKDPKGNPCQKKKNPSKSSSTNSTKPQGSTGATQVVTRSKNSTSISAQLGRITKSRMRK